MDGTEHLKQDEDGAGNGERTGQGTAALHCAHQHAHRDGEGRRKQAAQQQYGPPGGGKAGVRLRQNSEKNPLFPLAQGLQHHCILS